jgi:hypothetical protein
VARQGLFINYRRDDTGDTAQAVYTQLQAYFGADQVFMDVNTIEAGEVWPERLRTALEQAKAVLALIGRKWLFSHDEFGRRRLDFEKDWVRIELRAAIKAKMPIYPVLVGREARIPPQAALPADISPIAARRPRRRYVTSIGSGISRH